MIQENHTSNGLLKEKEQICPVCQTKNKIVATHCQVCAWYFQLANTPQYALELSRAKQQFQMINTFNQVLHGMKVQSKMLEKINFRLDGLENEMTVIKEQTLKEHTINQKYEYPVLAPIQKVVDFDTAEKRTAWWNDLEAQWQKAFNQAVLRKENEYQPTDEDIKYVLESPTLRLVGARGMHPSIDFELTNLSGVRHLTDLTFLVASHNALIDLKGIEHLEKLETLFVNANKLTSFKEVHYLPQLKKLYVNVNQLRDLHPIESLVNLEMLYCSYNRLTSLEGITTQHAQKLKEFTCLPNDGVTQKEVERIEAMSINCKKG